MKSIMKRKIFATIGLVVMLGSIGGMMGMSKANVEKGVPMMLVGDQYLNADYYEEWTTGEKAAWDLAHAAIGVGIGVLCPVVGAIYAF